MDIHIIQCCIIHYSIVGVQIQLDPIETQFLQEANPGDHAESTKLCVTIEADAGLLLDRAVIVTLELGEGGTGMCCTIAGDIIYGLM